MLRSSSALDGTSESSAVASKSGRQSSSKDVKRRCSFATDFDVRVNGESLLVILCISWRSCKLDVPTTLQKREKKGWRGKRRIVLVSSRQ